MMAPGDTAARAFDALFAELYARSGGAAYGLSPERFAGILAAVAKKYVPAASGEELKQFYLSLRVEELALARGCAAGDERAWELFLTRYREKLFGAAYGIVRDEATARELADSLYADLYGTRVHDGERVSKLESYTGRGSLEGWLRTVLAQEYVNRYRSRKRLTSLEEEEAAGRQFEAPKPEPPALADPRLEAATDRALASLSAEERFILAAYHLDGRTLAEVARMLGVHESTVSRKLDRAHVGLRKKVLEELAKAGMSRRQAEEALEADVRDLRVDIRTRLAQESASPPFSRKGPG